MSDIIIRIVNAVLLFIVVVSLYPDIQRRLRSETTYKLVNAECKRTNLILGRIHRYMDRSVYSIRHDPRFKNANITKQFDMVLSDIHRSISKEDMRFIKSVEPNIDYYISAYIYKELESETPLLGSILNLQQQNFRRYGHLDTDDNDADIDVDDNNTDD